MFPLRLSCAHCLQQVEYTHINWERTIVGTWVVGEVRKAVENCCVLVKVFQVWECTVERYSGNSGSLFTACINMFLGGCKQSEKEKCVEQRIAERIVMRLILQRICNSATLPEETRVLAQLFRTKLWHCLPIECLKFNHRNKLCCAFSMTSDTTQTISKQHQMSTVVRYVNATSTKTDDQKLQIKESFLSRSW
jgi:hypothetical protein